MRLNYKPLGKYIQPVVGRNNDLGDLPLMGLSIQKKFIPSIANTIGTDMSTYRTICKNQFAYGPVTSRNGDKITIALFNDYDKALISQAYIPFEVKDTNELDPEYLMMWFRRPEFDRYARFKSHGSAREIFDWEEMCNTLLPIPHIDKQREIVKEYNTIQNRIALNQQLIQKLEETAQAIYREWFEFNREDNWETKKIEEVGNVITGKTPPTEDEENFGDFMPFITIPDMHNNFFAIKTDRKLSEKGVALQKNKTLPQYSICVSCIGTAGLVSLVDEPSQTNQQINSIVCHKDFSIYYLFMAMKSLSDIIQSHGEKGSVGNNLNKQEFSNLEIVFPVDELLKKFQYKISAVFEMIRLRLKENQKLTELKDLLLSKLATIEN
jgi:type I restriction enzyme S subunit